MRLSNLSRSVAGRVVLVTGAASGMGRATAHLFSDEGAHVAVTDLGEDRVRTVVDEINDAHGWPPDGDAPPADEPAHGWVMDVADAAEVERVTEEICLLYTSPSPRDATLSRMPSSA